MLFYSHLCALSVPVQICKILTWTVSPFLLMTYVAQRGTCIYRPTGFATDKVLSHARPKSIVVQLFLVFKFVILLGQFGNRLIKNAPCGSRWPIFIEEHANSAET